MHFSRIGDWPRNIHAHLSNEDECFYLYKWMKGQDFSKDKATSLISNLKKRPSASPKELDYKKAAITECAQHISEAMSNNWIKGATFVPMPPSKSRGDSQYDDRMEQVCRQIADGIDVRNLLKQDKSITPSHERGDKRRPTPDELKKLWHIDEKLTLPKPKGIVIVDDMLTAGAHYRAAHDMLSQKFHGIPIAGVFIARRIFAERPASEADPDYKVYLNTRDVEIAAEDIAEPTELVRLRAYLDQKWQRIEPRSGTVSRLADELQRILHAQEDRSGEFFSKEDILDVGNLPRVVSHQTTSPSDTVVTLLLDNSGSMDGLPILVSAICADVLAQTLERFDVKVEILGFTTLARDGGQARNAWLDNDSPPRPGRLNDLCHIIYKDADTPWPRARANLGLMMRKCLLKENIDGEALEWAYRRMLARREVRKILMVISDGQPWDQSTFDANEGTSNYLEEHLRKVVTLVEKRQIVELRAIGILHDVTKYYNQAVTIKDVKQLADAIIEHLAALFETDGSVDGPNGAKVPKRP